MQQSDEIKFAPPEHLVEEEERPHKGFVIFGRDIATIPCYRNTFLYGISSGMGIGVLTFMMTSRPRFAAHVSMGSFAAIALVYWTQCRYNYAVSMHEMRKLQALMKHANVYEDSALERELEKKAKSA